jgi:hypothetical protein
VNVASYVRWPDSVSTLLPALSAARYLPDRHRIASRMLALDLVGHPLVPAPAHAMPIEYMEGPYRYQGTLRGQPVTGFAFYERSIALYRDWELIDVLAAAAANLRPRSQELVSVISSLRELVVVGRRQQALDYTDTAVRPVADAVPGGSGVELKAVLDDFITALRQGAA